MMNTDLLKIACVLPEQTPARHTAVRRQLHATYHASALVLDSGLSADA